MPPLSVLTLGIFADDPYAALRQALSASDHPHPSARIRDWAAKRLRAGAVKPSAIKSDLGTAVDVSDLPVVAVFSVGEPDTELWSEGSRELKRTCQLVVDVAVAESNLPEGVLLMDALDACRRVVELILLNDRDPNGCLGGQGDEIELGAQTLEIDEKHERQVFHARMEFRVTYVDEMAVPVSDQLELVGVQWDLAPPDTAIDAEDEIHPPQ